MSPTKKIASFIARHAPTAHDLANILVRGRFELMPPRVTYALGELHGKIRKIFDFDDGHYFEVGANNGLTQSNTAYLDFYRNWRGILVEAVPHKFVECVRNRPDAEVFHAGLVDFSYSGESLEIIYSDLMSMTSSSEKDQAAQLKAAAKYLKEPGMLGQRFLTPARTVMSIVDELSYPAVDLFSLDVEGAEASVLGGIDFSRWRPKSFLIESDDPAAMHALMASYGYDLYEQFSFHDFLYRTKA